MEKPDRGGLPRQRLLRLQHEILELVATGETLATVMERLCRQVEALAPRVICSILSVDPLGRVHPLAGPSLPTDYSSALDGLPIGPEAGSCGTAAFRNEPVVVTDIATDPLWRSYRDLALPHGLKACWSSPIQARDGKAIGTFAFYSRTRRGPTAFEREIVKACVHICAVAIEHDLALSHIRRIAYVDAVTGLANRAAFIEAADAAIADAIAGDRILAVHHLDLDDFKNVNDTLGHSLGDVLLKAIAERLVAEIGEARLVRLGGDEFAILQTTDRRSEVEEVARRTLAAFGSPFRAENHEIAIAASIGVVLAPADGRTVADLMKHADLALHRAKVDGRGHYRFYDAEMSAAVQARHTLEQGLKRALDANELEIAYQPIVRLATGQATACEALLRWRHPLRGMIMPGDFIQLAETSGLIARVGAWVMRKACDEAMRWPPHVTVAVNISPVQIRRSGFVEDVAAALAGSGLPPGRLELEITESTILAEDKPTRDAIATISAMGVGFALDDFGTGYSSLRFLRAFPFRRIKIDRSFIHDFGENLHSTSIVRTVLALARELGMSTTAEGIETEAQARRLLMEGCTDGQGFHFSRPLAAESLIGLLATEAGGLRPLAARA